MGVHWASSDGSMRTADWISDKLISVNSLQRGVEELRSRASTRLRKADPITGYWPLSVSALPRSDRLMMHGGTFPPIRDDSDLQLLRPCSRMVEQCKESITSGVVVNRRGLCSI